MFVRKNCPGMRCSIRDRSFSADERVPTSLPLIVADTTADLSLPNVIPDIRSTAISIQIPNLSKYYCYLLLVRLIQGFKPIRIILEFSDRLQL